MTRYCLQLCNRREGMWDRYPTCAVCNKRAREVRVLQVWQDLGGLLQPTQRQASYRLCKTHAHMRGLGARADGTLGTLQRKQTY